MPIINPLEYTRQSSRTTWGSDFALDHFQRFALDAIDNNNHVLITAHTGSGKTLPAEYAIVRAVKQGKRAIYTAPIKTLSNQKYSELKAKYPDISFGILTGDVKHNPNAQCLIMTTEILRNTLFQKKMMDHPALLFDIGVSEQIGCIVFDEVHYVNDIDRGHVWEETIMLAPKHTTFVMLSATINHPEVFASWIEKTTGTTVEICSTTTRAVPLSHHVLLTYPSSSPKAIANEAERHAVENALMRPFTLKVSNGPFAMQNLDMVVNIIESINKAHYPFFKASATHVLNQTTEHLREHNLLPAIFFVLSRKGIETYAKALTVNLSDDSHAAEKDFEAHVRHLGNKHEHLESEEYRFLSSLIRRGIAIHHSGMVPVLREAVELMFAMGHVKLLLATETFAVGVNMPAKAVVFTSLTKRSNEGWRALYPHEYTQMAGRAGRRGLDPFGHVFILPAMFRRRLEKEIVRSVMCGSAPTIESKFKIHFNLILRLLLAGHDPVEFTDRSMVTAAINSHLAQSKSQMVELSNERDALLDRFPQINAYNSLRKESGGSQNTRKTRQQSLRALTNECAALPGHANRLTTIEQEIASLQKSIEYSKTYVTETIRLALSCLQHAGFIDSKDTESGTHKESVPNVTAKGTLAANIQEIHSLMTADLITTQKLEALDSTELAALLSCFTSVRGSEEPAISNLPLSVQPAAIYAQERLREYEAIDTHYQFDVAEEYNFTTALADVICQWCTATTAQDCQRVFATLAARGVFKGEFIKAILKIAATAQELERVSDMAGLAALSASLSSIPKLVLKHVATNQSLYLGL